MLTGTWKVPVNPVSISYNPQLSWPDLWLSPGLPLSRAACCDPVMPTALCGRNSHLQAHCGDNGLPPSEWTHMEMDVFSWRRARFPPWHQHNSYYWITFLSLNSSPLHLNSLQRLTVIVFSFGTSLKDKQSDIFSSLFTRCICWTMSHKKRSHLTYDQEWLLCIKLKKSYSNLNQFGYSSVHI